MLAAQGWTADLGGEGRLRHLPLDEVGAVLPPGSKLVIRPDAIEELLGALDGEPPDWRAIYGHGHHDPGYDDRLFAFNRNRDATRQGRAALSMLVAFAWVGTLSRYDAVSGGFPVALGPKFVKTSWGMVRFKPEEAPGNLSVAADAAQQIQLQRLLDQGQSVEIDVIMTGRLIPEESIVYDFSHDQEGLGLIMPVVRVEQVDFVMPTSEARPH